MKKYHRPLLALALALATLILAGPSGRAAQPDSAGTLTVQVQGIRDTRGKLVVNLFRPGDSLFGKPHLRVVAAAHAGAAEVSLPDLPYGEYVAFAFHDLNDNGVLDHNWLHFPAEPLGYSNHWNFGLLTGLPTFEKTQFHFTPQTSEITIRLK
ncbi:MAG: DUF2141 domain-containing protein [Opitutae bacterium]|nr:DUF2141 domain-containing protein [Opitutae bacterium]